jgi:hypothetical protein
MVLDSLASLASTAEFYHPKNNLKFCLSPKSTQAEGKFFVFVFLILAKGIPINCP